MNNKFYPSNMKFSFGNDVEFCILNVETGKIESAIELLGRDKYNPIDLGDGIKWYYDNLLGETAFPPYYSKQEMFERFTTVFQKIQDSLGAKYRLLPKAAHTFEAAQADNDIARQIGCSLEYNAKEMTVVVSTPFETPTRTTGGHWHLGHEKLLDFDTRRNTILVLDIILGCASVIFDKDETNLIRRDKYGKAHSHRPTPFGLEYRVLASSFLVNKEMTELCFDLINYVLTFVENDNLQDLINKVNMDDVTKAINTCDTSLSRNILKQVNLPQCIMERINKTYKNDFYGSWEININS